MKTETHDRAITRLSLLVAFVALLVLTGWRFDSPALKTVLPGFISMKANTAVAFFFLAVSVIASRTDGRRDLRLLRDVSQVVVSAIALLTLFQYATGANLGIDEFLFYDPAGLAGKFPPGRLAPVTAINFILLVSASVLSRARSERAKSLAQFAIACVLLTAIQALVASALGVHSIFGLGFYTQMAIHTSILFVALSVALTLQAPERGIAAAVLSDTAAGRVVRNLLFGAILAGPTIAWVTERLLLAGWIDADTASLFRVTGASAFLIAVVWKSSNELLRAHRAMEHYRSRVEVILSNTDVIVKSLDRDGVFTFSDGRGLERLGLRPGERVGKSVYETHADQPEVIEAVRAGLAGMCSKISFVRGGRAFEGSFSPEIDARGKVNGVVVLVLDVNDRVEAERMAARASADTLAQERLRIELDRAEASTRAKSQFLANMSHEIRTPIHGIMGMSWLLLEGELTAEQREFARTIQNSSESLLRIVNDVLDFSKVEAGQLLLDPQEFSIAETLERSLGTIRFAADSKRLSLRAIHAAGVVDRRIGDGGRIQQILVNFLSNAVKFSVRGDVTLEVTAVPSAGGVSPDRLRFEVRDQGVGVPPAVRERVFDLFVQGDVSTTRKYGGTGLGLAISRKLVELMGGVIGVDSLEGHGSTFWFEIPLPVPGTLSLAPPVPAAARPAYSKSILVAEDNPVNQLVIRKILERLGHVVVIAANGEEAVAAVAGGIFDLVFMDCQMPKMDGLEATRRIRASFDPKLRTLPIVAITADAVESNRDACKRAGMTSYLSKPVRVTEIDRCVREFCPEEGVESEAPMRIARAK